MRGRLLFICSSPIKNQKGQKRGKPRSFMPLCDKTGKQKSPYLRAFLRFAALCQSRYQLEKGLEHLPEFPYFKGFFSPACCPEGQKRGKTKKFSEMCSSLGFSLEERHFRGLCCPYHAAFR